ncbi:NYN domain-containing protein [uncultured Phascolarctobacterium sp.]|uniref:NYN domain-containing protein n=1 Tax=uncultured Phascolarctobacterium sp. TaxID=512296 RepID=UPI0025FE7ED2|nr:NYN domain-containing protein [uncultured Phascolarctobacterium sp.]
MGEYLIVDGYNVINAWKEFAQLRQTSLEHARELLIAGVSEYAAFKGYRAIVVFDAQEVAGAAAVETVHGIQVVYTNEGETADSWIERRAYELGRGVGRAKVFVVTSDYAEQINILGAGAYRISAREFREDYLKAKKEIAARLRIPDRALNRNELGGRINGQVLEHLEKLRRRKS